MNDNTFPDYADWSSLHFFQNLPNVPQQMNTEPDIDNKAISIAQKIFFDAIVSAVISELLEKGYIKE